MVNRTQALVLGFLLLAWVSLLVILVAAPDVYDQALRLPDDGRVAEIAFLAALSGFIALLAVGVVRRWRWTFWLMGQGPSLMGQGRSQPATQPALPRALTALGGQLLPGGSPW